MYEPFFGIKHTPFSLTPDPAFLLMTRAHGNVKAGLTYAILAGKGFTVLTGEAGTGKTTLLRSVINSIPQGRMRFSLVTNPVLTPEEFTATAIADFGLPECDSHPVRLRMLQNFLLRTHAEGKVAVLFVDEAHRLPIETLEEIRLMTNFETETKKLLQIVLAGQDELGEMLGRHDLRQIKQRVEVWLNIGPLAAGEVWAYIQRRWTCVGGSAPPFSPEGVRLIAKVSSGIPRLINTVCDNSLLLAFAENSSAVTVQHVREASKDLHLTVATEEAQQSTPGNVAEPRATTPSGPTMELNLPAPVSQSFGMSSSSLFATPGPKRSWWWPNFSKAQKAGVA